MSLFKLEIKLDNADYHDSEGMFDPFHELCTNLSEVALSVANGFYNGRVRDTNGNIVGNWSIKE